jgi:hypothetical protein
MSGILDLLTGETGQKIISGLSKETGESTEKTTEVLSLGLPALLSAMQNNASSTEGAAGLLSALSGSKHDGSILDNLGGLFSGGVDSDVGQDGGGILSHILGSKSDAVAMGISQKTGVNTTTVLKILKIAAPILLGYLSKKKSENNINTGGGLTDLLGGLTGAKGGNALTSLLDQDGDGSILDDVAGMLGGETKKSKGMGGMLGGLFGK